MLWWPKAMAAGGKVPVVVMIAGSGPTDRDGNNVLGVRGDSYRLLAEALAARGIASLRYDKRGVGGSTPGVKAEAELTFGHFVDDAAAALALVGKDPRAGRVTVLGHSEGGLIALSLATRSPTPARLDGLVLVAAPGRPLGVVLREQLATKIPPADLPALDATIAAVGSGKPAGSVPPSLSTIFRPGVVPFLAGVLSVDPAALAARVTVPVAVVQGETDAQVAVVDARRLAAAHKATRLTLLPRVNHVLKEEASAALPQASYTDPSRPLGPGVVDAVVAGIAR